MRCRKVWKAAQRMQRVSVAMAGVVPLLSRFTDARACQCCAWWHAVSVVSRLGVCQNVCQNVCKFGFFGTHFGTLNIILIMCVLSSDRAMHTTIAIMMLHNDTHAYVINHRSYLCLFFSLLRSRLRISSSSPASGASAHHALRPRACALALQLRAPRAFSCADVQTKENRHCCHCHCCRCRYYSDRSRVSRVLAQILAHHSPEATKARRQRRLQPRQQHGCGGCPRWTAWPRNAAHVRPRAQSTQLDEPAPARRSALCPQRQRQRSGARRGAATTRAGRARRAARNLSSRRFWLILYVTSGGLRSLGGLVRRLPVAGAPIDAHNQQCWVGT